MRFSFVLYLFIFSISNVFGQEIRFRHLNVNDGLGQTSVLSIAQDRNGFIWLGTRSGLSKYNSRTFKNYQSSADTNSISSSSYILKLLVDHEGTLWIGTAEGLNSYNEKSDNFKRILPNQYNISGKTIYDIYQDRQKRLWFCSTNGLSLLTDKEQLKFKTIGFNHTKIKTVYTIFEDRHGIFWLSTNIGLVSMKFDNHKIIIDDKSFRDYNNRFNTSNDNRITSITEDRNNILWIGTKQSGLSALNVNLHRFVHFTASETDPNGLASNNIRKITVARDGKLWLGTLLGINILDPLNRHFTKIENDPADPESLSQNSVYDIFQDKQDIMWVGTYYGGINYTLPLLTPFRKYPVGKNGNALNNNVISTIIQDKQQNLWVATEGGGVNYLGIDHQYRHYIHNSKNNSSLSSNLAKALLIDSDHDIWIGTYMGSLDKFQPSTKNFMHFSSSVANKNTFIGDEITYLLEDSQHRFWIGTNKGLNQFFKRTGSFQRYSYAGPKSAISALSEDDSGNIWAATLEGLYVLNKGSQSFKLLKGDGKIPLWKINSILPATANHLWLGTNGQGLFLYNFIKNTYRQFTEKSGLPSNNIVSILEDHRGNLWISTDKGLSKYDLGHRRFFNYDTRDGLPGNEFNYHSAYKSPAGELFFGSLTGLTSFFPDEIKINSISPKPVFTGLKLFNKPIGISDETGILTQDPSYSASITLKARQNIFSVDFATLNFIKSEKNRYAYKLEGFEDNWNNVSTPSATYTNISPGDYTLLVKGCNNDGIWSNDIAKLNIKVLPPLYRTWWAYIIYTCLFAAILFMGLRYVFINALLKKEQENNHSKLNFFTNISHEIRTPLTLILSPLEQLLSETQSNYSINKQLQVIKGNADRLMRLITELLDFRKAEAGKMHIQVSQGNIVKFCNEIFLAFVPMAQSREIQYTFQSIQQDIDLYFDKQQLEKVLFNLLSNAFKFTTDGGRIILELTEFHDQVTISVKDYGRGISAENQKKIFTNFFQVDDHDHIGTGIGLAFSKSIIELHHGQIEVTSNESIHGQPGETIFSVHLQKGKEHFSPGEQITDYIYYDDTANYSIELPEQQAQADITKEKEKSMLIVEDNTAIRKLLVSQFIDKYDITEASNGLNAWETASELIPDIIISDVMMPEMDGLKLCQKLKTDERTSHIPVILLTARATYIHQINGLETGADAYITKPFNTQLLQLNVRNLLASRTILQEKYSKALTIDPKMPIPQDMDQAFISRLMNIIEENMSNNEFSVLELCTAIGMSHPVLYKKIRAVSGLSVNDFLKSTRLKRAVQLLQLGQMSIKEIAYAVGFSNRKYFSMEFKKQYGKTPSEFLSDQKGEE